MKQLLLAAATLGLVGSLLADEPEGPDKKAGYIIGHNIGSSLTKDKVPVDVADVERGLRDAMQGKALALEPDEVKEVMQALSKRVMDQRKAVADARAGKAKEFAAAFAKEEGVKATESGLMYKVITAGKGDSPKATDKVRVHYRGTLVDGQEFDSSYKRGEPTEFQVGGVIPGWTEALKLMTPGAKWKLYIPSNLAYGERGAGGMIGPNEDLIFEVELLEVVQ